MASRSETLQVRDISFQGAQGEPTRLRAEVCIPGQKTAEIWFEYNASLPEPDNSGDPFLLCLLHRAMHLGLDLSIDGPVHPQLLRNLEWMIELWTHWKPERYQKIHLNAEIGSLAKPHGRHEGAILLYSGGVDSTHALIQYANGALGRRSVPLKQALLVEGADVSLDEEALWATTLKHAEAILSRFAVPLASVRTNVRALCGDWEDSHGCVLAACAWPWQSVSSTLVVAGSIHPENLANAWGSHPVSDHLLSLPHFEVTTDSLTRSRAEKISKLCDYSEILSDLRYCYSQKADELNCGQCRKCTFTKLAFLACGADIGRPRLNRVLALASAPDWLWAEAQDVLDLAKAKGNTHHIAIRLLKCLSFLKKGC